MRRRGKEYDRWKRGGEEGRRGGEKERRGGEV